ncbi:MAG: hypothetical protein NTW87_03675 [Planctomycetota bacterium]|nr:hypothetical protein [Planctomycetota bacterium]
MKSRVIAWLLVLCVLAALVVKLCLHSPPPPANKPPVKASPAQPAAGSQAKRTSPAPLSADSGTTPPRDRGAPVTPGEVRLADDADNKQGDFWLEQALELTNAATAPPAGKELLDLYLALDARTQAGVRVRLKNGEVALEQLPAAAANGAAPAPIVHAKAALAEPLTGEVVVGVLWRKGQLSVWNGPQQILQWAPAGDIAGLFRGPSAVKVLANGIWLGARRTLSLGAIRFDDTFMRDTANGDWRPFFGKWELTALAFPERSANPFSLRAAFGDDRPVDDKLYQGRTHENQPGIGIVLSAMEGTLHIGRITGGAPAARAGLAEDDIFLEVDGVPVNDFDPRHIYQLLLRGFGGEMRLRMLRPGEKQPRDFRITREDFRWGTPAEGVPIPPVREPGAMGGDRVALIGAGEAGWSDYAAEVAVKALGTGGMGLAFGVLSPQDYLVFRWRGPAGRQMASAAAPGVVTARRPAGVTDRLQLVRVAGGKETVLAEHAAGYRPYEFYRLGVDWSGDSVRCTVDDNEVLKANVPELKRGQIALYALKGDPVFFDDVHVYSDRAALAAAHHPERAINEIFAAEQDMEVWANPALEWCRDIATGWAVHEQCFPGEEAVVLSKPRFKDLTVALFCGKAPNDRFGELLVKDGQARLRSAAWESAAVRVGDGPFQRIAVRATPSAAEADIDGVRVSASSAGIAAAPAKLGRIPDEHVAIHGLRNLGNPETARVSSSNTIEYTFNGAPTDWKVACGRWGLLNKWICDPRWSWFGARSKTLAALWNKCIFSGDISVDAHVSLMMQQEDPPYERSGDYSIAICGDGVNLDSGYTLIFGGDNNSWTRLYRKGQLVAESTQEAHRVFSDRIRHPDKPELHQRWFHLKLEKIGNSVSFYRDNVRAFTFNDPDPLPEGRVAFWTMDNGFLLSRVRIAHGGMRAARFEPRLSNLYEDARVVNLFDGETLTAVEPQALPPAIEAALASPKDAFKPADADPLPLDAAKGAPNAEAGGRAPAYRVVNGIGGGPFALQWKNQLIDPDARGVLRFAYCIEPGANVDLYLLDVGGRSFDPRRQGAYRWRLTGPRESDEFAPLVGEIPGVQADGRWHAVQFDLNPSWRALWQARGYNRPGRRMLRLMMGNLDNHGYLLAGMNGNHAGAAYSVSDIMALTPREVDRAPPQVARVVWPYDADGDGRSVAIVFSDSGGAGIADESLQAILNEVSIQPALTAFDHVGQTLRLDLLKLNLPPLTSAPTLKLTLLPFQDRAQNSCAGPFSASYTFDAREALKAAKPVAAPRVTVEMAGAAEAVPGAGPLALSDVEAVSPVARLQESTDAPPWAPYGQRRSLQVVNMNDGSAFGFAMGSVAYSLRHWPYVQLEYKMPAETPVNLHVYDQGGTMHAVILGDTGDGRDPLSQEIAARAGPPPDFICDGTWRRTTIPVQRLFAAASRRMPITDVRGFSLHDNGWRGSRRAMQYWVHRLQPVPAGRTADFRFAWQEGDISGVTDYASCLDQEPETDPAGKQEIASGDTLEAYAKRRGAGLNDGWHYLHVRVKNGPGVWSAASHRKFFLDNTPPRVVRTAPPDGGSCSGQTLRIFLEEEHGVDLLAVRLSVNGEAVTWRGGLEYDPAANCLSYNAAANRAAWPDGTRVSVDLYGLKDQLGNQAAAPYSFSFKADRSGDKKGPAIAQMRFVSPLFHTGQNRQMDMETSFGLDFEEHTGHVRAMRDCRMEWLDDPQQACFGRRAVKITALDDDADVQVMLHKNPWYLDNAPLLQFDYRADPGMRVDILAEVLGQWLSIRLTGDGSAPAGGKAIGRVEAVMADGSWRHASVDLKSLIDAAWPDLPVRIVNKVVLSAQGREGCKRGASITIDNLDLARPHAAGGRFEWLAEADPSGIAGYSYVIDQAPTTVPPEALTSSAPSAPIGSRTGVWYLHVRGCDQAGNWGPTRTMRVDLGQ